MHINIGLGRVAKGFFSVGLVSVGVVSVGPLSPAFWLSAVSVWGLVSIANISAGLIAFGGAAIGFYRFRRDSAVGALAIGGCAVGAFSCGGFAYGSIIAVGDVARGGIAVGDSSAEGSVISVLKSDYELMKTAVYAELDKIRNSGRASLRLCEALQTIL